MIFCRHDYKVLDKTVLGPMIDKLKEMKIKGDMDFVLSLCQRTIITILKCSKCGRIENSNKGIVLEVV